jgi:hypothetical protein
VPGTLSGIPQLPEEPKRPPLLGRILGERTHGHEALQLKALEPRDPLQQCWELLRKYPALLRLGGAVDLKQYRLTGSRAGKPTVELGSQVLAVERVNERESADHVPGLVALQGSDQVPMDRDAGQQILLLEGLLDPVLADISKARR